MPDTPPESPVTEASDPDDPIRICRFLVPVHDNSGELFPHGEFRQIEGELEEMFDGWTQLTSEEHPIRGGWRGYLDLLAQYEIGVPESRLPELRQYLSHLAHRFGQEAIWLVTYTDSSGEAIVPSEPTGEDG